MLDNTIAKVTVGPCTLKIKSINGQINPFLAEAIYAIGLLAVRSDPFHTAISELLLINQRSWVETSANFPTSAIRTLARWNLPFRWINGNPKLVPSEPIPWQNCATLAIDCINCEPDYIAQILETEPCEIQHCTTRAMKKVDFKVCHYYFEDCEISPDELLREFTTEIESWANILIEAKPICKTYFEYAWFLRMDYEETLELTISPDTFNNISKFDCELDLCTYRTGPET